MELSEIRERKEKLEQDIFNAIAEFEYSTLTKVTLIGLNHVSPAPEDNSDFIYSIKIEVTL